MVVEDKLRTLKRFREFLRSGDKEIFDDLMNQCRPCASYTGTIVSPVKEIPFFMAMLFEQHKRIMELEKQIKTAKLGLTREASTRELNMRGFSGFDNRQLRLQVRDDLTMFRIP
jgi:hypothetical protein